MKLCFLSWNQLEERLTLLVWIRYIHWTCSGWDRGSKRHRSILAAARRCTSAFYSHNGVLPDIASPQIHLYSGVYQDERRFHPR